MSSSSPTLPTEIGQQTRKDALPIDTNLPDTCLPNKNYHMEHEEDEGDEDEDEDEEEDVDFNPFLKETLSPEASSSLSSEIEGLDADVAESEGKNNEISVTNSLSNHLDSVQDYPVGDSEHGEEIVMKTSLTSGQERNLVSDEASFGKENGSGSGIDVVNDAVIEDSITKTQSGKPTVDLDDEDAICMRTRARYSLANFTLDQLENFLQETDDDDDLRNIDDEEEYRKFLAAVLQGGDGDCQNPNGNDNVDDEDEDNDADFELEIEEALESDIDENIKAITEEHESKTVSRRPKTRQNRRQKASVHQTKMFSGQLNRPLRPLLPNAPLAGFAAPEARFFMAQNAMHYAPSSAHDGFVNGFTPSQIGQLHCLIHEHVQLLLQVFSLCVLDPARQHISSDVQGLISDIFSKFNQVLAWRKSPYPSSFFCPPYIKPSVGGENIALPPSNGMITSNRVCEDSTAKQVDNFQSNEGFLWMPYISGPILSILDVAPLRLAGSYINDVSTAMQEHRRRVGLNSDTYFEKEPLFPLRNLQSLADNDGGSLRGVGSPSSGDQIPRKTMAAALVERAKKQSVALVPKEIAQLAQRFLPLFNPALYPHKPPPAPVANRVLFTDAEDKLLALGLMEYNTDWKAIQQRFLPCKSKHQIFVRQKNRSSSKAPENPIKAVRRMKNSPLTAEEKARIEEGLKVFKLDWVSVWKFIVPYRDPSLLPRQWRIANGTQKSYKLLDADKKAKRRLYESMRRKSKPLAMPSWNVSSGKEDNSTDNGGGENKSVDDCSDKEDEAYVHEAFLADWRPNADASDKIQPTHMQPQENSQFNEQTNNIRAPNPNLRTGQEIPNALSSRLFWRPYRARRNKNVQLVKLAPDLPPVNLPPSVRIMSQSAFKSFHGGPPSKNSIPATQNGVYSQKTGQIEKTHLESFRKNPVAEEKGESELHMHPLLFSGPENSGIQLFSSPNGLFPANQTSLNLSLFHNPNLTSQTAKFFDDSSSKSKEKTSYSPFGIDFHPLLQKDDNAPSPNGRGSELNFEIQMEKSGEQNKIWSESSVSVPKKVDKSVGESMRSGDNAFGNGVNFSDLGDESLPEIVMEKEELSDSEEEDEIGENVEFECEEMADSDEEDEGYNSERIVHVQNNKELQNIESEKAVAVNGSDKAPPIDFERLNLNSRPPDSPGEDPGSAPVRNRRVPVAKRQPPSRSGGRFKSPGTPLKKPRKRARMNESNACESEQIGLNL